VTGFEPRLVLTGKWVELIPLEPGHAADLAVAGQDPEVWRWLPYGYCGTRDRMDSLIAELLDRQSRGTDVVFTVTQLAHRRRIGMTRFMEIDRPNRNVEIGGTWLSSEFWRTPLNTESKRLLLGHAFEREGCVRVQLKTDIRNERSQRAIERLGAVREGIRRRHLLRADGTFRDSVYYSILDSEWPAVRTRLDDLLARPWPRGPGATG
jgi:RimJ/RimL family protein N-acetyltransferase